MDLAIDKRYLDMSRLLHNKDWQKMSAINSAYGLAILTGLNGRNRYHGAMHVYGGTVSDKVQQDRRQKNRVARKSRQTNRKE